MRKNILIVITLAVAWPLCMNADDSNSPTDYERATTQLENLLEQEREYYDSLDGPFPIDEYLADQFSRLMHRLGVVGPYLAESTCSERSYANKCFQVRESPEDGHQTTVIFLRFGAMPWIGGLHQGEDQVFLPPFPAAIPFGRRWEQDSSRFRHEWDYALGPLNFFNTLDGGSAMTISYYDTFVPVAFAADGDEMVEWWEEFAAQPVEKECVGDCPMAIRRDDVIEYCRSLVLDGLTGDPQDCIDVVRYVNEEIWILAATGSPIEPARGFGGVDFECSFPEALDLTTVASILEKPPLSLNSRIQETILLAVSDFRFSEILRAPLGSYFEKLTVHIWRWGDSGLSIEISPYLSKQNSTNLSHYRPASEDQMAVYRKSIMAGLTQGIPGLDCN